MMNLNTKKICSYNSTMQLIRSNEQPSRFSSITLVNSAGELIRNTLPAGSLITSDYHLWKNYPCNVLWKKYKLITREGELLYICEP